jgi:hypothetical protein
MAATVAGQVRTPATLPHDAGAIWSERDPARIAVEGEAAPRRPRPAWVAHADDVDERMPSAAAIWALVKRLLLLASAAAGGTERP